MSSGLVSYFNPWDNSFNKYEKNLTSCQQTKAYIAGILGLGIFSFATYRLAVQTMSEDNAAAQERRILVRRTVRIVTADDPSKVLMNKCKKGIQSPTVHPLEKHKVVPVQSPVASPQERLSPTELEWNTVNTSDKKTPNTVFFGYFS